MSFPSWRLSEPARSIKGNSELDMNDEVVPSYVVVQKALDT
jgi:hypothetical protein